MKRIIDYIRRRFCRHEYELVGKYVYKDTGHYYEKYKCKKCGHIFKEYYA